MRKSFILSFLLALLTTFALPAKTLEVPLNSTSIGNSSSSYVENEKPFTVDGFSFNINNFLPNDKYVQGRAKKTKDGNFYLYNTTALPNITKVEITMTNDVFSPTEASATKVYTSDSAISSAPSSGGVGGTVSGSVITYDLSKASGSYFRFAIPTKISGTRQFSTLVITYDEGGSVETAPDAPTFSVAAGAVREGTNITVTSKGATSLEISAKVGDAADFTTSTVTGNTYTFTVNENTEIKAVGINDIGRSEEASATYTIKEVIPGSEETYTVTFSKQSDIEYAQDKTITWVADEDPNIKFETSATSTGSNFPKNDSGRLRIYNSSNNTVIVNAPIGYKISKVAAVYKDTKSAVLIDGEQYNTEVFKEYAEPVSTFNLKSFKKSGQSGTAANSSYIIAMNLVLVADGPVVPVAPTAVTVTPSKTDAKVGETVSITLSADGTPAPKIYYTTDGTTPTETSQEYKGTFDITCDEIAGDATEAVIRVTALAVNATGSVTSAADVKYTRNEATVTVKDPSGNVVTGDMTMVLEDGAKTFTAETNSDVKVTWMSSDYGTLDENDSLINSAFRFVAF